MPEYLAPGVYVEEVPSGSKPIEGASTSTAAMVGMTQRGPVNTPTLVTSAGSYARQFGGLLHPAVFTSGRDALPYAAEGFFTNGGSRLWVVRVVGDNASESRLTLVALATGESATRSVAAQALAGEVALTVSNPAGITAGDLLLIADGARTETAAVAALNPTLVLASSLANVYAAGDIVTLQTAAPTVGVLQTDLLASAAQLQLDDDTGIVVGTVLRLRDDAGDAALDEIVTVTAVTPAGGGNPAQIDIGAPLARGHAQASTLEVLTDAATAVALAQPTTAGLDPAVLAVPDAAGFAADSAIRIAGATTDFAIVTAVQTDPAVLSLGAPLAFNHAVGAAVSRVQPALDVHALSPGVWGDSLRVSTRASAQVETTLAADATAAGDTIRLATAFGLFPGSVLVIGEVVDLDTGAVTTPGTTVQVATVDAAAGEVNLTAPLGADHAAGSAVRSQELTLVVERLEADKVVESEAFDKLSLAAGHPRNALTVVGSWDTAAGRPSRSGASALVRLSLPTPPAPVSAVLVHGLARFLDDGADDPASVDDDAYVGTASDDPDGRTGIQALENEPTISIVAVPGQTSVTVQKALVAHCEKMRYRFAVLDTPLGVRLGDARSHRQNFDTTRAAVYYPGLVIADRFGAPGELMTIPSAGHMLGIMARTDTTRGVHKAPANEVVRGILQFETKLGKGEQDILNPIHVNCYRDFREENRGLRIYGARVATSDPEFKYINVRRLLLFIEQSLDNGLQWAVFEPNDQPLWDTVKQSVSNFLVTVWRSGALAGTKQEEAFFVNIGYNITMTQDDIDNGRMIVEIGVAPVKPAEFVIVRISQKTREATS
jgi:Bacteriophage tail sheath protein